jgi:effector-binding domain-containing protein
VHIDASTGYRYYTLDQLPRLNRILALKDLGLSLASIRRLLDEAVTPEEIGGMLRLREAQLEQEVAETQARLQRVKERLRQMAHETETTLPEVAIRTIEAQNVLAVREVVPDEESVGTLLRDVFGLIVTQAVELAAPPMTIFHDPEFKQTNLDVEAAGPVTLPVGTTVRTANQREIKVRILEALPAAACTLHIGSYDAFAGTYAALGKWIELNGGQMSGPPREIYLRPPAENEPALTEIQIPIERKKE